MSDEVGKYLRIAALTVAGLLGAWTARACFRAQRAGVHGSDAAIWAGLALVFLMMAQAKTARLLGWLRPLGIWLRVLAREMGVYSGRRPYQIAASLLVLALVSIVFVIGVVSYWNYIKRYRLAIGFAGLVMGLAVIRFISLHEVDAWNSQMPWLAIVIDLVGAVGASAVAVARLRQVWSHAGVR